LDETDGFLRRFDRISIERSEVEAGRLDAAKRVAGKAIFGIVFQEVDSLASGLQEFATKFRNLHVQSHLKVFN
jgi:hypothetical protein